MVNCKAKKVSVDGEWCTHEVKDIMVPGECSIYPLPISTWLSLTRYDEIVTRCTKMGKIRCTSSKKLAIVYAAIKELENRLLAIIDVKEGKGGESPTAGQNTNEIKSQEHMNSQNIKDPEVGNQKVRPPTERKKGVL
ncbi:hypothetical protein Syun_006832 [Stephania yunnanensis]|uniref:Uncharacterized protein n=1 Tax=Stephania yunnanensis TaxID=152371 RepID=A0AAP0KXI9_9MAGN